MPIPDYQTLMLPILQIASDGIEHSLSDIVEELANKFQLTEDEKKELLPSGRQAKFKNRVGWAKTYLKKAGLLNSSGRGKLCITQRGLDVLKNNPTAISREFLQQFPEFLDFQNSTQEINKPTTQNQVSKETPEEFLELSYQTLKSELAQEILQRIKSCSPKFFEKIVVDLLLAMGYGGSRKDAGEAVGQTGDGGVDGIIKEDKLGFERIYIQAKKWESTVGRPIVQAFAGSLEGFKAKKGVLITTSQFSKEAKEYVKLIEKRIILIDGETLSQLMIEYDVGVTEIGKYILKKIDSDYFDDDSLV
jgi:restriction system protein